MSTVETIKEKLSIEEVVSRYLKLEKAGASLKAKCPFHNEKTASFFVSPSRGTYYCFGCGAKGDIFTFVEEFERVDFVGALKILADQAGVEIVREDPSQRKLKSEKEKLLTIMEEATSLYEKNLAKHPEVLEYFSKRGLKEKTIKEWRLGFAEAPKNGWTGLLDHLKSDGFKEADIEKAGLIKKGEPRQGGASRGSAFYDRFRARMMFPIFDPSGRPIAFSGRILDDKSTEAKYINSPESPLFNKSSVLYGYDKAKQAIRELNYAILVEGQMDLLMMHQAGLRNTIASSGTALSDQHLKILKRSSENLLLAYDGDGAGLKAALRAWNLGLSLGMEIKIAAMPKGEDPASLIGKDPDRMKSAMKDSKHIITFYLDAILSNQKDKRKLLKEVERELLPFVRSLPSSVDQAHFISLIADKVGIKEEALFEELNKIPIEETENESTNKKDQLTDDFIARRLWGMIYWQEGIKEPALDLSETKKKISEIMGDEEMKRRDSLPQEEKADLVFEAEAYYGENADLEREANDLLWQLEEDYLKNKFGQAMTLLQEAEKSKDSERIASILKECQELSQKISARKKVYNLN